MIKSGILNPETHTFYLDTKQISVLLWLSVSILFLTVFFCSFHVYVVRRSISSWPSRIIFLGFFWGRFAFFRHILGIFAITSGSKRVGYFVFFSVCIWCFYLLIYYRWDSLSFGSVWVMDCLPADNGWLYSLCVVTGQLDSGVGIAGLLVADDFVFCYVLAQVS